MVQVCSKVLLLFSVFDKINCADERLNNGGENKTKLENRNSNSTDNNSEDDDWREVKRKSKEGKGKKESKAKTVEREELEFYFDEELDQEVPAGRQNMFTTDW